MRRSTVVALFAVFALAAPPGPILADETVPFPFWQHGFGVTTMWSIVNDGLTPVVVTITLLDANGGLVWWEHATVGARCAWITDTGGWIGWYLGGDNAGFGRLSLTTFGSDSVHLWACVYGLVGGVSTGFSIVFPDNPYGMPDRLHARSGSD